jgi:hypothetical protein
MINSQLTVLEVSLNRAEFRWKWLRFLKASSVLGILLCLAFGVLGALILSGRIKSHSLASAIAVVLCGVGLLVWVAIVLAILISTPDRRRLAAALERREPRFLDRLNTLLFLKGRSGEPLADAFASQIARQTHSVFAAKPPPPAFPAKGSYAWLVALLGAVLATAVLNQLYSPWDRLAAIPKSPTAHPAPDQPLDLSPPPTNNLEQDRLWGEVRINEPGTDLQVTKMDVVPLQIEAAATMPLKTVGWFAAVNGGQEMAHALPAPADPKYALYQPTLFLDELNLADWDVLTYYARAEAEKDNSFASEVYFLEVRPFREDILKLPGGEGGSAYQRLNEISSLINRQEHVIRQTHQHVQKPPEQENVRTQDRSKLQQAESDLRDSTQHLYAKIDADRQNKAAGMDLDSLGKAVESFEATVRALQEDHMPDAQQQERSALSELVAARKMFQKAVGDAPASNQDPKQDAGSALGQLNQMTEFRDEAKAAEDFVKKTLEEQKRIQQQSKAALHNQFPRLANQQQTLNRSLQDFSAEHPQVVKGMGAESRQTEQAMSQAAEALQQYRDDARSATEQATGELEKLAQALRTQAATRQLADAYRMKQMLDEQARTLGSCSRPGSSTAGTDLQKTTREARETVNQLRNSAELEPTRDAFGPALRDALTGQNKVNLDAKLLQLEQAQDELSRQECAGAAKTELDKVSKAFEASQPQSLRLAQQNDSLKPNATDGISQGMAELESLLKQLARDRRMSPGDQVRQGQQALWNLQRGMRSQHGDNQQGNQLLLQLGQMLKSDTGLDPGDLQGLLEALQRFSTEASGQLARADDKPEMTNIDPSRLPPAYRGRIQRYFQKLSEP